MESAHEPQKNQTQCKASKVLHWELTATQSMMLSVAIGRSEKIAISKWCNGAATSNHTMLA